MRKFFKGLLLGLLLALPIGAVAIIGGGVFVHNHSGNTSGGNTLNNTTLVNPTIIGGSSGSTFATPHFTGTLADPITLGPTANSGYIDSVSSILRIWSLGANAGTSGAFRFMAVKSDGTGSTQVLTLGDGGTGNAVYTSSSHEWDAGANALRYTSAGSLTSSKNCAANYSRVSPNFCIWTGSQGSQSNIAVLGSCTGLAAPAGAVALWTKVSFSGATSTLNIYNDGTCATVTRSVAGPVGATIETPTPIVGGNSEFICSTSTNCTVTISGYFD